MISVIVPVLNESSTLGLAVARLKDNQPAHDCSIVDGGSEDGTREIAAQLGKLVLAPRGRGAQMNPGAEFASGEVLLFLHVDVWLEAAALSAVQEAVSSGYVGGMFRQRIDGLHPLYRWIELTGDFPARGLGVFYGDVGIFMTRAAFEDIGGFPEVSVGEEFEFSSALCRVGPMTLLSPHIHISARRWRAAGIVRATLRN